MNALPFAMIHPRSLLDLASIASPCVKNMLTGTRELLRKRHETMPDIVAAPFPDVLPLCSTFPVLEHICLTSWSDADEKVAKRHLAQGQDRKSMD